MNIKEITTDELRTMKDKEGLIIQGCGGPLEDWVNGINDMLTKDEILLEGSRIENCMSFNHKGLTCILFPFEDAKINTGKLAIWRLLTHSDFHGTWLSDYVPNTFGGFVENNYEQKKPNCALIGKDGNIFNLMALASRTLRRNGMSDQASEMCGRIQSSHSYHEALNIIGEYVNIVSDEEMEDMSEDNAMKMGGI